MFVFLLLVALALADYPIDFDTSLPRDVGSPYWLPPGVYSADVTHRNFADHIVEFSFIPVHEKHQCVYSVWLNDEKVMYGNFYTAVATTVPTLAGSFNASANGASEQVITVHTEGCNFGRYAVPLTWGWNGDSALYVYDWSPAAQDERFNDEFTPLPWAPATFTYFESFAYYYWSSVDGLASVSSQANDFGNGGGWFYSNSPTRGSGSFSLIFELGGFDDLFLLPIDTRDIMGFNDTEDAFVVELTWFSKPDYNNQDHFAMIGIYCNSTATGVSGGCDDFEEWESTFEESDNSIFHFFLQGSGQSYWDEQLMWYRSTPTPAVTPNTFYRHYIPFDYNEVDTDDIEVGNFLIALEGTVLFPQYFKLWSLDPEKYSDPMHVLVDMRGDWEDGDDCAEYCDAAAGSILGPALVDIDWIDQEHVFTFFLSRDEIEVASYFANVQCRNNEAVIHCPAEADKLDSKTACDWDALNDIDSDGDTVETGETVVSGLDLPYSGYVVGFTVDYGVPTVVADGEEFYDNNNFCGTDAVGSVENNFYPIFTQLSSYSIQADGESLGWVSSALVDKLGLGRFVRYGEPANFHLGNHTTNITLKFVSAPSLSITYYPFLQINGFDAPLCTDDTCEHDGVCADPWGSTQCHIAGKPGLWRGENTDEIVPYCTDAICQNGGECQENEDRDWDDELFGTGGVISPVWCACKPHDETDLSLGYYWGEHCQYASPCATNPCLHEGKCSQVGNTSEFTCDCSETISPHTDDVPYEGERCEIPMNTPCHVDPCLNGGECTDDATSSGGFSCDCSNTNGWSGHTCNVPPVDVCLGAAFRDHCGKFGQCIPSNEGPDYVQCVCIYGWSGDTCNEEPAGCAGYCQNGGDCISVAGDASNGKAACLCEEPWVGQRCEWNMTVFAGASSTSVSLFGALFLAVLAFFF